MKEEVEDTRYKEIPFTMIAEVYRKNFGNVSATCDKLGIDRSTFNKWRKKYPQFDELIDNTDEFCIDFAESKLLQAIGEGNLTAVIFYLKTKGKKRGYIEAIENNVKMDTPVKLTMDQAKQFLKDIESEF